MVMSIEVQSSAVDEVVSEDILCRLSPGVQVRKEKFGLLFYDYRGPRLYFLPTGDLISDTFFSTDQTVSQLIAAIHGKRCWSTPQEITDYVKQVFAKLMAKGLIHGQSLC
jgi:putative mycofactocin binding protein MftB